MGSLTIHFECTSADSRLKAFLAQDGIESAFLLNANPEQIQYALDHVSGIVVVRVYDPFREFAKLGAEFEKDIVLRHTPTEFVNWLQLQDLSRFRGNKRVRFILGWNEMFYAGADYQRKQNEAMIKVASFMILVGYGVALHGLAADKTLQKQDCADGVWDSLIEFLIANEEWAHLDIHEYEVGRLASQHLKHYPISYPRSIEDPASMDEENWGEIDYSGNTDNWHIGRIAWLLARSRSKYGKEFNWARGEMGWDYKDDGALRGYIPEYMTRYGKPQGLPSLRPLFNQLVGKMLSDIELCTEANKDLSWFVSFNPKSCLSDAIFADNPSAEHKNFNLGQPAYDHLYKLLGQQAVSTSPPVELPEDAPMTLIDAMLYATASFTRIRASATTNSAELGRIPETGIKGLIEKDYATKDWPYVEVNGVKGYSLKQYLRIEPIVVAPLPTDKPEYEVDFTIRMTPSVRAAFREIAESLANAKLDE